jgi:hypothetical protein
MDYLSKHLHHSTRLGYDLMYYIYEYADSNRHIRQAIQGMNRCEYFYNYYVNHIYSKYLEEDLEYISSVSDEIVHVMRPEETYALRYSVFFTPIHWLIQTRICGVIISSKREFIYCDKDTDLWELMEHSTEFRHSPNNILNRMIHQLFINQRYWSVIDKAKMYQDWLQM